MGKPVLNQCAASRAALLWGLAVFALSQLGLAIVIDRWRPELRDPEYGYKLQRLRERLAREPGRPLLLLLGSSRVEFGVSPEMSPLLSSAPLCNREKAEAAEAAPLVFNFAISSSGPLLELLCFRRLLAAGIRPRWVVIEVLPPLLHQEHGCGEERLIKPQRLGLVDVVHLHKYAQEAAPLYGAWLRGCLTPSFTHRFGLLTACAPAWAPLNARQDWWRAMDASGWLPWWTAEATGAERQVAIARAYRQYRPLLDRFQISPGPAGALNDLLTLCRRHGASPLLLIMPEGNEFRSWYSPEARTQIDDYLARLSRDYQAPLIDAREWMADEAFLDGHHLTRAGAMEFSQRLMQGVIGPLLRSPGLSRCRERGGRSDLTCRAVPIHSVARSGTLSEHGTTP